MGYSLNELKKYEELNKIVLDKIEFPIPDQGENFDEYLDRVKDQYMTLELPPELQGELFCFMSTYELGEYLKKRYGWTVEEEIQYYIWR